MSHSQTTKKIIYDIEFWPIWLNETLKAPALFLVVLALFFVDSPMWVLIAGAWYGFGHMGIGRLEASRGDVLVVPRGLQNLLGMACFAYAGGDSIATWLLLVTAMFGGTVMPKKSQAFWMRFAAMAGFLGGYIAGGGDPSAMLVPYVGLIIVASLFETYFLELRGILVDEQRRNLELNRANRSIQDLMQARQLLLARVTHELRTPLNGIVGTTELLEETDLTDPQRVLVGTARNAAGDLVHLVNDLLQLAQIEAGRRQARPEAVNVAAVMQDVTRLIANSPMSVDIDVSCRASLPHDHFLIDPTMFRQVLINLMGNAAKFTRHGRVDLSAEWQDDLLRVTVSDTGIGIRPEELSKLFQPFVQANERVYTEFGGSGLGLSISKALVEEMGGGIGVESEVGVGSVFFFDIPAAPCELVSVVQAGQTQKQTVGGARVLVVDDHPVNLDVARAMLRRLDVDVDVAQSGSACLTLLKDQSFDLLMLDYYMPDMNGAELAQRVKTLLPDVSICMVSANLSKEEREASLRSGANGFVDKPLTLSKLRDALGQHLPRRVRAPATNHASNGPHDSKEATSHA